MNNDSFMNRLFKRDKYTQEILQNKNRIRKKSKRRRKTRKRTTQKNKSRKSGKSLRSILKTSKRYRMQKLRRNPKSITIFDPSPIHNKNVFFNMRDNEIKYYDKYL